MMRKKTEKNAIKIRIRQPIYASPRFFADFNSGGFDAVATTRSRPENSTLPF